MNILGTYTAPSMHVNLDVLSMWDDEYCTMELKGKVENYYHRYYRKCRKAFASYIMRDRRRRGQKRG